MSEVTYPHPYRPILKRLVAPPEGDTGQMCIQCDKKWLPYLLTVVTPLLIDRTWESDAARATEDASTLITQIMLSECVGPGNPEEGDCVDYTPQNAPVWWGPTNPFINPYDVPAGYILPPWQVVPITGIIGTITGLQEGDVITTPLSFPIAIPPVAEDITKFRIYCSGTGTVEIHLIQFPLGGVALITHDDNILTLSVIELNRDFIEVPPETVTVLIHEVEFATGGDHHIDVTFERRLDDDLVPAGFGGGLRKIVLCGFDIPGESVDVRQNVDAPCTLEKSADGETWVPFADLKLCPPNVRINKGKVQILVDGTWQDAETGDERTDGDADPQWESPPEGEDGACLAAENLAAQFVTTLTQTKTGLESGLVGSGIGGIIVGTIGFIAALPAALIGGVILALITTLEGLGIAAIEDMIESDDIDTFKCIMSCHASSVGAFTVDAFNDIQDDVNEQIGGVTATAINQWLDSLGPVGMTRAASSAGITTGDCDLCCAPDEFFIDFATGDFGGASANGACTFYGTSGLIAGTGWFGGGACNGGSSSECSVDGINVTLPNTYHSVAIECEGYPDTFGSPQTYTLIVGGTTLTDTPATYLGGATWFDQDFSGNVDISFYVQQFTSQCKVRGIRFHV